MNCLLFTDWMMIYFYYINNYVKAMIFENEMSWIWYYMIYYGFTGWDWLYYLMVVFYCFNNEVSLKINLLYH